MDDDIGGVKMAAASATVMAQLAPQMDSLIAAVPNILSLGPNTPQLVAMGKAMFQGAMQIPAVSPVQASYVQGIQQLADAMRQGQTPATLVRS